MFGCLTVLLTIVNIGVWIVFTVISFFISGGAGCSALIGTVGYLLSWGIVDGSIMSPVMYFYKPMLTIWGIKASFCNGVGIGLWALAGYFLM